MPFVVSETVTFEKTTVIGGEHSGEKLAVRVSSNSALPFCCSRSVGYPPKLLVLR